MACGAYLFNAGRPKLTVRVAAEVTWPKYATAAKSAPTDVGGYATLSHPMGGVCLASGERTRPACCIRRLAEHTFRSARAPTGAAEAAAFPQAKQVPMGEGQGECRSGPTDVGGHATAGQSAWPPKQLPPKTYWGESWRCRPLRRAEPGA